MEINQTSGITPIAYRFTGTRSPEELSNEMTNYPSITRPSDLFTNAPRHTAAIGRFHQCPSQLDFSKNL